MSQESYTVRTMSRGELDMAVAWAAREGWNPGLYDAENFYAADPDGFLVGLLDEKPIACISAVRYPGDFGFLGFYIVAPEYRGKGFGLQVWDAGMARLRGCAIGLDGVVEQQPNYCKSGFQLAWNNVRYRGVKDDACTVAAPAAESGTQAAEPGTQVVALASLPFARLAQYDARHFPALRADFLRHWICQPGGIALGAVRDDELRGYGVLRPCHEGVKIGPLFAENGAVAEQLLQALVEELEPATPYYLDIPEPNTAAVALVQRHHMQRVFETARMYTGAAPLLPLDNIFGITTFELG